MAYGLPEPDRLRSRGDNPVQITNARSSRVVRRCPVLSHPIIGATGLLDCGLAFAGKTGLESGLAGFDDSRNAPPVQPFGCAHFERGHRSYFSPVVPEATRHDSPPT